jgi:hypothetical protein
MGCMYHKGCVHLPDSGRTLREGVVVDEVEPDAGRPV